jgi:S1-C subfamily serine protease
MITANALSRVFHIKAGDQCGTAFTIELSGKQYLITAAHVVRDPERTEIELFHATKWKRLEVKLTGFCTKSDIAVYSPGMQLSPLLPMAATAHGVVLGQDAFFLGFPLGVVVDSGSLNRGLPFPVVKKACVAGIVKNDSGTNIFLLDGINNLGFSGGPVVFQDQGARGGVEFKVMSVVSGYRFSEEPTYHQGQPTKLNVRQNTGIIITHDIKHAVELIESNPNGVPLDSANAEP